MHARSIHVCKLPLPADAVKPHGGALPRPSTFMPGAAAKPASVLGAFTPPLPPNSPGGRNTDGLAEQGGPALFKPASLRDTTAAGAAPTAAGAATDGTSRPRQGGAQLETTCGRCVLHLLAACVCHSHYCPPKPTCLPFWLPPLPLQGARGGAVCAAACCRCSSVSPSSQLSRVASRAAGAMRRSAAPTHSSDTCARQAESQAGRAVQASKAQRRPYICPGICWQYIHASSRHSRTRPPMGNPQSSKT